MFLLGGDFLIKVNLHITNRCNLKCPHCFLESSRLDMRELELDVYKSFFKQLSRFNTSPIHLTGGEALIRKDCFDIIKLAKQNNLKIELQSNGLCLDNTIISKLKSLDVKKVYISIDGLEKEHDFRRGKGSYKKAIEAIKNCIEKGISVSVNICVSHENKDVIFETIKKCASLKVHDISLLRYNLNIRSNSNGAQVQALSAKEWIDFIKLISEKIHEEYRERSVITAAKSYYKIDREEIQTRAISNNILIFMTSSGEVYPCGPIVGKIDPIGIFPKDTVEEIINRLAQWECPKREICKNCAQVERCGGGCIIEPEDSNDFCSNQSGLYNNSEWYPGCPCIQKNLMKDLAKGRWPHNINCSDDFMFYYKTK